uniref:Dermokine n=1 Tax=Aotus nancymaae TaxID=37293 RepID=A0A2K5EBU5_AOTNA
MKFQGSLACLLLALFLGSGEAGPLQTGGENTAANVGEATGHGMGDALSQGVGQAVGKEARGAAGSGVSEALGQGTREAVSTGVRQIPGIGAADALGNRVGEAAHALGNTGHEIGRQAEDIIRHTADAVHGSWQGVPGHNGAWETSGGHGIFGSQGGLGSQGQGNPGGLGTPWGQGYPGSSTGSFGTNPQGAPWVQGGNGGLPNLGTNAQGAVAQPGYGSVRGSNPNSGVRKKGLGKNKEAAGYRLQRARERQRGKQENEARGTGGSGVQEYRGQGVSSNMRNSETSPGLFNFDTFWKNFKSKLGFINWDAINKDQRSAHIP